MNVEIEPSWRAALADEFQKPYFTTLAERIREEYQTHTVYPKPENVFNAFSHTPLPQVRVVILGQDPYHGPRQAHGLAFSVPDSIPLPPSLQNIYKEIRSDLAIATPNSGDLTRWADQGVFLLNATLTVRAGEAGSHQGLGWETFTDRVIEETSRLPDGVVYLLWGAYAQKKQALIDTTKHLVLTAPHPSPLSAHRGFLGCRHFSQTNAYLTRHGHAPIAW